MTAAKPGPVVICGVKMQAVDPQEMKKHLEYFRNNLLPVLLSQQRRKELGADKARQYWVD